MIKDILEYSKVTSKKLEFKHVNVEHVLEKTLARLKMLIDGNNAIITHDPLPNVYADEKLLIQLFQNLISNAIKYHGKETPHIHIYVQKEENNYRFEVKDNGIGISPEYLKQIFTIFKRLHTNEEYEGTGIGLAIAEKIIQQFKGTIWAESELGKGSTFDLTIPTT